MANKKLDEQIIKDVKTLLHFGFAHKDIADAVGISKSTIGKISSKQMRPEVEYVIDGTTWN